MSWYLMISQIQYMMYNDQYVHMQKEIFKEIGYEIEPYRAVLLPCVLSLCGGGHCIAVSI